MQNNNEKPLFSATGEVPQNIDMGEQLEITRIEISILRENHKEPDLDFYSTEN